jgi:hypothetical protein
MPVADDSPGENSSFAKFADQWVDNFLVCAVELIFTPFVALLVFLRSVERERRPIYNVSYDQLNLRCFRPIGCVLQCTIAAFTAVNSNKQYLAHFSLTS